MATVTGLVRPKQNARSNLLYSISNLAFANSNAVFQVLNVSLYASNLAVFNSNALYPRTEFTCNALQDSSNATYSQHTFASNLGVYDSNITVTLSNQGRGQSFFSSNGGAWSSNAGVYASNLDVVTSNALLPMTTFTSNTAVASSNILHPASNVAFIMSNALNTCATFASNAAVGASNTAFYDSNLVVQTSNVGYPLAGFSSNTAVSGCNTAVFASNIALQTSNAGYPNTAYSSNALAFSSNIAQTASNVAHDTSNLVSTSNAVALARSFGACNVVLAASNLLLGTSNASFARTVYAAVAENFASALTATATTYLEGAVTSFASAAATFGSNHAFHASNELTVASNELFAKAAFTDTTHAQGCNVNDTMSNYLYPLSVVQSNLAEYASNAAVVAASELALRSAEQLAVGTFASNTAAFASNLGAAESNYANSASNELFAASAWLDAKAAHTLAAADAASNAAFAFSNTFAATAVAASNAAGFAHAAALVQSDLAASEDTTLLALLDASSNVWSAASNDAHVAEERAEFASNLAVASSNFLYPISEHVSLLSAEAEALSASASNGAVAASNALYPAAADALFAACNLLDLASLPYARSNLGFYDSGSLQFGSLTLSGRLTGRDNGLHLQWSCNAGDDATQVKAAVHLLPDVVGISAGLDHADIVTVTDRRVQVADAPVTFVTEMSVTTQLAVLSSTCNEAMWPSGPHSVQVVSEASCNVYPTNGSTVVVLASTSAGLTVPVPVCAWAASMDAASSDGLAPTSVSHVLHHGAVFAAGGQRRRADILFDASNCPGVYGGTPAYPVPDAEDALDQGFVALYDATIGAPRGISCWQSTSSNAVLCTSASSNDVIAGGLLHACANVRVTGFDGLDAGGPLDFDAHFAPEASAFLCVKYARAASTWHADWATALTGARPLSCLATSATADAVVFAGAVELASNACELKVVSASNVSAASSAPSELVLGLSSVDATSSMLCVAQLSGAAGTPMWVQAFHLGSNGAFPGGPRQVATASTASATYLGASYTTYHGSGSPDFHPLVVGYANSNGDSNVTGSAAQVRAVTACNAPAVAVVKVSSAAPGAGPSWVVSVPGAVLSHIAADADDHAYIACSAVAAGCCNLWMYRHAYSDADIEVVSSNLIDLALSQSTFERAPGEQAGAAGFVTKISSNGDLQWTTRVCGPSLTNRVAALHTQASRVVAVGHSGPDAPSVARSCNVALDSRWHNAVRAASGAVANAIDDDGQGATSRYSSFVLDLDAASGAVRCAASVLDGARSLSVTMAAALSDPAATDMFILARYNSNLRASCGPRLRHGLDGRPTNTALRGATGEALCLAKHRVVQAPVYTLVSPEPDADIGRRNVFMHADGAADTQASVVRIQEADGTEAGQIALLGADAVEMMWTGSRWAAMA